LIFDCDNPFRSRLSLFLASKLAVQGLLLEK
jgi:hypothetical protein